MTQFGILLVLHYNPARVRDFASFSFAAIHVERAIDEHTDCWTELPTAPVHLLSPRADRHAGDISFTFVCLSATSKPQWQSQRDAPAARCYVSLPSPSACGDAPVPITGALVY